MFSLLDKNRIHYLEKNSAEEEILREGNPMDLLPKEPRGEYIFEASRIIGKKK